jgi:hypothetical protein
MTRKPLMARGVTPGTREGGGPGQTIGRLRALWQRQRAASQLELLEREPHGAQPVGYHLSPVGACASSFLRGSRVRTAIESTVRCRARCGPSNRKRANGPPREAEQRVPRGRDLFGLRCCPLSSRGRCGTQDTLLVGRNLRPGRVRHRKTEPARHSPSSEIRAVKPEAMRGASRPGLWSCGVGLYPRPLPANGIGTGKHEIGRLGDAQAGPTVRPPPSYAVKRRRAPVPLFCRWRSEGWASCRFPAASGLPERCSATGSWTRGTARGGCRPPPSPPTERGAVHLPAECDGTSWARPIHP